MLSHREAAELADRFDLDRLPACPMCLFDLASAMQKEEPAQRLTGLLTRTSNWVWMEIDDEVHTTLVRLQMREVPHAEAALADIHDRGWRSRLVRELVNRLARRMADELAAQRGRGGNGHGLGLVEPPLGA
jgi:hypothetical protein